MGTKGTKGGGGGSPNLWDKLPASTRRTVADAAGDRKLAGQKWEKLTPRQRKALGKIWKRGLRGE